MSCCFLNFISSKRAGVAGGKEEASEPRAVLAELVRSGEPSSLSKDSTMGWACRIRALPGFLLWCFGVGLRGRDRCPLSRSGRRGVPCFLLSCSI
jgi:hypothetical protein